MIETERLRADFDAFPQKEALDALAAALAAIDERVRPSRPRVLANRVVALAALRLYQEWQREIFFRED